MTAKVDVFMPIFVGDYLADTTDLTTEEHGAYLLLLFNLWKRDGRLPCDPPRLARMVGLAPDRWDGVWLAIGRFFDLDDGHISQGRLLRELEAARARKAAASNAGKASASAREAQRTGNGSATPVQTELPTEGQRKSNSSSSPSSSSSSPSSTPKSPSPGGTAPAGRAMTLGGPVALNLYDRTLAAFRLAWEDTYGEAYATTPADRSQLGRLLGGLSKQGIDPEALPGMFANYLADTSRFVADEKRHSLAWFCTDGGVNKYRTRALMAGFSDKERRGVAAGQQWLSRGAK